MRGLVVLLAAALCARTEAWSSLRPTGLMRVAPRTRKSELSMRWGLKGDGVANKPSGDLPEGVALRDTVPFELRGFSLPLVVFSVGVALTATSFGGFFLNGGGDDGAVSSLGFVYGIPVFLIGLSLWYAEIKPVEVITSSAGDRVWEAKKTDTLEKILKDVTRHRYGDDAHLDSTLESLGLKLPQKKFPKMLSIQLAETPQGELEYTMTFQSAETPYKVWNEPDRVRRYSAFFGPGVYAECLKVDPEKRIVAIRLTTTTNGPLPAQLAAEAAAAAPAAAIAADSDDAAAF